jgi:NAD(P)-dependent dehydrogenase (short-subunit alcohol dehydrogenase family)
MVALLDQRADRGAEAVAELGAGAVFLVADVTVEAEVEAAVLGAVGALGGIDILVNCAGIAPAHRVLSKSGGMFPLDLFKFVINVNLIGTFDVTRRVAAVMARNQPNSEGERGVIINVASIAAFDGQVGQAAYSASKGGIVGMTLPLARDLASSGIRVNTIAPGIMDTPLLAGAPPELVSSLAKLAVFPQRLGTPEDFAKLVMAIIENPMLNGETIRLDAGARMPPK